MDAFTAQYRYDGPHRLDITAKTTSVLGKKFAPPLNLVYKYKDKLITNIQYSIEYFNHLYNNVTQQDINDLLNLKKVVFVCYCPFNNFCHRYLLINYLKSYINYQGEIINQIKQLISYPYINSFKNEYLFLSNFSNYPIYQDNILFNTNEHYFQSKKATNNNDFYKIINAKTAKEANQIGKHIKLKSNWDQIKNNIMYECCLLKFMTYKDIQYQLINTFPLKIIENNNWNDKYWGVVNGVGENKLGKILMYIRNYILNSIV